MPINDYMSSLIQKYNIDWATKNINYFDPTTGETNPFYNRVDNAYGTAQLPEVEITTPHTPQNMRNIAIRQGLQYMHNAQDKAWNNFGAPVLLPLVSAPMDFFKSPVTAGKAVKEGVQAAKLNPKLVGRNRALANAITQDAKAASDMDISINRAINEVTDNLLPIRNTESYRSSIITAEDLLNHPNKKIRGEFILASDKEKLEMLNKLNSMYIHYNIRPFEIEEHVNSAYKNAFPGLLEEFDRVNKEMSDPVKVFFSDRPPVKHTRIDIPPETKDIFESQVFPRMKYRREGDLTTVFNTPVYTIKNDARNNYIIASNGDLETPWDGITVFNQAADLLSGIYDNTQNLLPYIMALNNKIIPHELRHSLDNLFPRTDYENHLLEKAYSAIPNPFKYAYDMSKEYPTINLDTRILLFKDLGIGNNLPIKELNLLIDKATNDQIIGAFANANGYTSRYVNKLAELLGLKYLPDGTIQDSNGTIYSNIKYILKLDPKLIQAIKEALKNVGIGTGVVTLIPKLQ